MKSAMKFGKLLPFLVVGISVLVLWSSHFTREGGGSQPPTGATAVMEVPYYSHPDQMELCGEPVPLHVRDVRERMDREFTIVVHGRAQVYLWLKRIERYFPWLEEQLALHKLPDDLKYVAVAESDLILNAVSPARAAGPWQFIPDTGSRYGLNRSDTLDERYDFELATASALRYLQDLYALFNDWTLAIAAYNCGENRVLNELRKQKVASYYDLKLPTETERYVFRILAVKEVLANPQRYGYSLPEGAGYPVVAVETVRSDFPCPFPMQLAAEAAGMTYRQMKDLNPSFTSDKIPAGRRTIKVYEGKGQEFSTRLEVAKAEYKPVERRHKVARGETLTGIAARYGVGVDDLRRWNGLEGEHIQVGQLLKILE
ncbi:MAG: transglycosylase SLT domain-containing protein [Syntrophobacteraceae bacterium]|nr:transglycosylase SLT domain-containing protein [Syntrophobacteraceae bacterium]